MKTSKLLLVGAVALFAFASCESSDELESGDNSQVYDDAYYAARALISSSDAHFNTTSEGGTISFKAAGGEVVIIVSCGTEWTAQNSSGDTFGYNMQPTSMTITAEQNLVEKELSGTITLMTAENHIKFATITITQNAYGAPEITVDTNEWHVPAVGENMTATIEVEATDEWTVECGAEWLTIEKSGTGLNLSAEENEDTEERSTEIVLTCADGYNSDSETIRVLQDGTAYITLGEEELYLSQFGDVVTVVVESNFDWECAYEADWLTVEKNEEDSSLTITYTTNETGNDRDCTLIFITGDGAENVAEAELPVFQTAHSLTVDETEWHAPAVGELTKEIGVEAPTDWTAETETEWLTLQKTETSIIITAKENQETTERSGEVVLTCTDGVNSSSESIAVTQDGLAYITLSEENLLVSKFESTTSVTVESNFDWEYSYDTANGWLTIEKNGEDSSLKIAYTANETGSDREETVTITSGDGAENIAVAQLTVKQSREDTDALILEYTITSSGTKIELPIYNTGTITIQWDDGTATIGAYGDSTPPSHTYSTPGIFDITISGNVKMLCTRYRGSKISQSYYISGIEYLTAVKQWGNTGLTSMYHAFDGCSGLTSLPEGVGSFSNVNTFEWCFANCSGLTSVPSGLFDNCPHATTFENCFTGCHGLTSVPSGLFDNCPSITSFCRCFANCIELTSVPSGLFDNCPKATTFESCFNGCSGLTSVPSGLFDNCPKATTFESCFNGCSGLTSVPSGLFDNCPSITSFRRCFYGCIELTSVPSGLFDNCPGVTTFANCFGGCSGLTSIPSGLFDNCPSVTTFANCFDGCKGLTSVPSGLFDNCPSVTDFDYCFDECTGLTTVPENMFSNCTVVKSFDYTFYNCSSLISAPSFDGCSAVTSFDYTFYNCTSLISGLSFKNCSAVTKFYNTFTNCTNLVSAPTFEGCTNVTSFESMFSGFSALTTLPEKMFSGCSAVTSFYRCFYNCSALTTIPVNIFDGALVVTSFGGTFYGCSSVSGESPYTVIEVNGEKVNVHLYERSEYDIYMRCKDPSGSNCFTGSSFSDIDSIPSSWGGNK